MKFQNTYPKIWKFDLWDVIGLEIKWKKEKRQHGLYHIKTRGEKNVEFKS